LLPIPIVGVFLKETPERMGLLPDGLPQTAAPGLVDSPSEGLSWKEIRRRGTFWVMIAAAVLLAASVNGCIIHMPAIFADRGTSAKTAALASSIVGLGVLFGRIGCGYFLDRYFGPYVAALVSVHAAAGIALLWMNSGISFGLIGAFLIGLGMGAEVDIMAFLMSRYFGLRAFGTAFGLGFGLFVLAAGLGPLVMGVGFDLTGSYRAPMVGFFVATLAAAALLSRFGPYRYGLPETFEDKVTELQAEV
jgi:MFS family permease